MKHLIEAPSSITVWKPVILCEPSMLLQYLTQEGLEAEQAERSIMLQLVSKETWAPFVFDMHLQVHTQAPGKKINGENWR